MESLLGWAGLSRVLSLAVCAVLCVTSPAARGLLAQDSTAAAPRVRVAGVVFDSIAMRPLAAALVRLVLTSDPTVGRSITSAPDGGWALDRVPLGTWLATALHPTFDSLGLEPPVARLEVREGGLVSFALTTPSARTLVATRCGTSQDLELGLLFGVVRSTRDEGAVAGAAVSAEWPEWVIGQKRRGMRTEMRRALAHADSSGRYAMCGVPASSSVRVVAWGGADSTGMIAVEIPPSGVARHDFAVAPAEWVMVPMPADSARGEPVAQIRVRRGRSTVRGRAVGSNGRPVDGATVRVLGSGNGARADSDGTFTVTQAAAGTQTIEARAIGFQPARQTIELRDDATPTVTLTLAPQAVVLDTVRVMAGRTIDPAVTDFERRWRMGTGVFMDNRTVRERAPIFLTDALRALNGVTVVPVGGYGQRVLLRGMDGRPCAAEVFVDGVRGMAGGSSLLDDFVTPAEAAAVEVYPRAALVPLQFQTTSGCGVVVVWTRQRFGGVEPRNPRVRQ